MAQDTWHAAASSSRVLRGDAPELLTGYSDWRKDHTAAGIGHITETVQNELDESVNAGALHATDDDRVADSCDDHRGRCDCSIKPKTVATDHHCCDLLCLLPGMHYQSWIPESLCRFIGGIVFLGAGGSILADSDSLVQLWVTYRCQTSVLGTRKHHVFSEVQWHCLAVSAQCNRYSCVEEVSSFHMIGLRSFEHQN